jgi:hypothetical protein
MGKKPVGSSRNLDLRDPIAMVTALKPAIPITKDLKDKNGFLRP